MSPNPIMQKNVFVCFMYLTRIVSGTNSRLCATSYLVEKNIEMWPHSLGFSIKGCIKSGDAMVKTKTNY